MSDQSNGGAQKQAAAELLHQREQEFRAIVENSPDLIIRFDREYRLTYVNPATAQLFQLPREAFLGKVIGQTATPSTRSSPEGLVQVKRCLQQVITTGAPLEFEMQWPTPSGERLFSVRLVPELDRHGAVESVLSISRDVTERRQLSVALKRVLRHARTIVMRAVVTAPDGWEQHQDDPAWAANHFRWDSRFDDEASAQEVLPLELEPGEGYHDGWNRAKLREDQGSMGIVAHSAFLAGAASWQQEFRCSDRHGQIHWFAQVASIELARPGCWRVTTVNTEITERKRAQQALTARENEFRTLAENTPDFIVRWDRELRRVYVNPAFAASIRSKPEELIGDKLGTKYTDTTAQTRQDTIAAIDTAIRRVFADGRPGELLIPWTTAAGEAFHYLRLIPERDEAGALKTVLGIGRDITALKETEEQLRALTDNSPDLIVRIDREYRYLYVNRAIEYFTGTSAAAFIGQRLGEMVETHATGANPEQIVLLRRAIDHVFATGEPGELEGELQLRRGSYVLDGRFVPEFTQTGEVGSVLIIARDVTERKRAEEALRQSQQAFASLVTTIDGIVWEADPDTFQFSFVSPQAERILGYPASQWMEEPTFWAEHLHPDDRARAVSYCVTATREMRDHSFQYRMVAANGRVVWLHDLVTVISENGRPVKLRGIMVDITRSKRTEEALALFRTLIDQTTDAIEVIDPATGRFLDVNETACRAHGYSREEFLSLNIHDIESRDQADSKFWLHALEELRRVGSKIFEGEHRRKDGSTFPVEINANYVAGANDYVIAIVRDTTDRKRAEEALRESEYRFRQVTETIDEVFWLTDVTKNTMIYISPAYEKIWGRKCAALYENPHSWLEAVHAEDRDRVIAGLPSQRNGIYDIEYRITQPGGAVRWIHDRAFPIRDTSGAVYRIAGVAEDITARRQLEEQFRQSQKMEAIGQLAGGIAHDFNNLLTVVQMQTSLLLDERRLDAHAEQGVRQIMDAANRAANLTRQLLAFSRQQVKQAHALDLVAVVASTTKLLRRVLGEHISLESRFASNLPLVHADPGMMEQVLMNLVINARDAMPDGGSLTIAVELRQVDLSHVAAHPTARVGRFVRITVTDTGSGIEPEILPRIFEPFFTTKEVGKGTGLGLATVFGIVQHHQGWIEIDTAVGRGSAFHVYLPPMEKPADQAKVARTEPSAGRGSETVLLVEDEPAVASVAARALARRGYNVVKAGSAAEALRVWDEHFGKVDLLLTDLVMPGGVSGLKLAEELRQRKPDLKVIYTSGYSSAAVNGGHEFEVGRNFLPKPYPLDELTTIVRQRLDER